MQRTVFGFAARMVGGNVRAALLAGLRVRSLPIVVCFLVGGAAGLAGMAEVAAVHGTANASLIAGYGYAGILVAFIARHNPMAVVPVAILLGGIGASGGLLQRSFGLPDATVNVLQGILFVVILASDTLTGRLSALLDRRKQAAAPVAAAAPAAASFAAPAAAPAASLVASAAALVASLAASTVAFAASLVASAAFAASAFALSAVCCEDGPQAASVRAAARADSRAIVRIWIVFPESLDGRRGNHVAPQ
jgi:hypothetical protein